MVMTSECFIELEDKYGAHNYHPIPVVLSRGEGVYVWDTNGKKYYDFLSCYSAMSLGHCHPRIIRALTDQASRLTLTSRAFYNEQLGQYEKFVCDYFGYEKVLPMNTGVEAVETAIKLVRKWAYEVKKVPQNKAKIVFADGNFHGRTIGVISASTDPECTTNFGPVMPGYVIVRYNDIKSLKDALEDPNVAAFIVEPIQGEAGVNVPDDDYLKEAYKLCRDKNVLMVADEIQTGIARTGKLLALDHVGIKPDVLLLGKALGGGVYPVSCVLTYDKIMNVITPGTHGSTFGGNPLACAVATESLRVVKDENLEKNAEVLGSEFRAFMQKKVVDVYKLVKCVRGKGLLNALVIDTCEDSQLAWNICLKLAENGLLAKPTHGNIIRFAPPLTISKEEILQCCTIIEKVMAEFV